VQEEEEASMKKHLVISILIACALVFSVSLIYAGTQVADEFELNSPEYDKHKKGIVKFSHKKHNEEYGAACGECHHDDKGKALADLKMGDDVQKCIECHKKPGERPKGKDAPKLNKKQRLEYHAEALHYNCKDCHKDYNKKNKTKAAPTTCTKCHPKNK
jgi:cytochrome c553